MRAKSWIKAVVAACLLALICTPAWAQKIKIAVAAPLTGPAASYGENIKSGVETKVEEINAAGGINGVLVDVEYFDDLCEPRDAASVASRIVDDKEIVGVVGHVCSSAHLAAVEHYVRRGLPVISPTATAVNISQASNDKQERAWSFRNVYRDDYQGNFLASYVKEVLGLERIAIFYAINDYGIGLKDSFVTQANIIGLEIVGQEGYTPTANDFTPQLTKLRNQNPDGLFISGYYQAGALIANQAKQLDMDVVKFGADGLDNVDYIINAGAAANNTYMTVPFLAEKASDQAQDFIKKFEEKYQRDLDWMSANSYDAAGKFIAAILAVGTDRTAIRDYLAGLNSPDNAYIGVTGATYFNAYGDTEKGAYVKMVQDESFIAAPKQLQ